MGQSEEQRPTSPRRSPDLPPLPPPIQPYSGFLGNGKSVIRPIAFKPLGGRLSAGGERYGSTPVLASRPPSLMTLYGSSSDVRESRWCGSPQPASLSALPPASISTPLHQRHHSAIVTKSSSGLSSENKEPVPAPSPADSGVSELERDQHEYSTAERLRSHEVRVRAPRGLALQGYASRRDEREAELARVRRDRALLRQRLEDTEWSLCQRAGEIALLKTQLKEAQNEQTAKGHEYLTLKAECRQLREVADKKEQEAERLRAELQEAQAGAGRARAQAEGLAAELAQAAAELARARAQPHADVERLQAELRDLRHELSDVSLSGYEGAACGRARPGAAYHWSAGDSALEDAEVRRLNGLGAEAEAEEAADEPERLRRELRATEAAFRRERARWADEKDKVLRYQKQLQLNYVQMFKRSRALEAELDGLRLELRLCDKGERAKPIQL